MVWPPVPYGDLLRSVAPQIDAYAQVRATGLRRTTLKCVLNRLRSFLRFLHGTQRTSSDLSGRLITPTLYQFESIPSVLQPQEIAAVLRTTRRDRSALGRRDFAILTLLAMYGLRAGEIVRLTLKDIDWRAETIRIRHSKSRGTTLLPLLPAAGEALLAYLFRHAHAVALLRAAVPVKTISDLLGHRASASTAIYLKLNSEEPRAVALPLPDAEVAP